MIIQKGKYRMHKIRNVFILLFLLTLSCLLNGCSEKQEILLYEEETAAADQPMADSTAAQETETEVSAEIRVYVCGAVVSPGVITLTRQERIGDAIAKAGGLTAAAEPRAVNQAGFLEDGMQILVPTQEEVQSGGVPLAAADMTGQSEAGKVNLNQADTEELKSLPGIGDAKAADIIRYREQNGGFKDIEEIKNISGIKDAVFEKLKDKIAV